MTTALLIIDVQSGMYGFPDFQPHSGEAVIETINTLIGKARSADATVIFVQHDGGEGHPLDSATDGFAIDPRLHRKDADPVIVKKHCAAFHGTNLAETLESSGVDTLVVCGIQTDHCVDSAVRIGVDKGYTVVIAKGAHTTFDTEYLGAGKIIEHHEAVWNASFGPVTPVDEIEFR
jgi:nicotinamidase-related amidase